jgi:hypothetical protein
MRQVAEAVTVEAGGREAFIGSQHRRGAHVIQVFARASETPRPAAATKNSGREFSVCRKKVRKVTDAHTDAMI